MNCREFEDNLSKYFQDIDEQLCRNVIASDDWQNLPIKDDYHKILLEHASKCLDCSHSLWQYLEIRSYVDYHNYPCFHLAYFSHSKEDKCITFIDNLTLIITNPLSEEGIVIGFCPWCGIRLNVAAIIDK